MALESQKATITLPKKLLRAADSFGRRRLKSRSELVKDALLDYLARHRGERDWLTGIARRETAVPADDEPYTLRERRDVAAARKRREKGEYLDLAEVERLHVARRRRSAGQ